MRYGFHTSTASSGGAAVDPDGGCQIYFTSGPPIGTCIYLKCKDMTEAERWLKVIKGTKP